MPYTEESCTANLLYGNLPVTHSVPVLSLCQPDCGGRSIPGIFKVTRRARGQMSRTTFDKERHYLRIRGT